MNPLYSLNNNLVSRLRKSLHDSNDLTSKSDTQELLYDTEDISFNKKERRKCGAFKNTQTNVLTKEATNALTKFKQSKNTT